MTLPQANRHTVIERHLLMAQRCNAQAAQLYQQGQREAAQRQRELLAVFLHNALQQLPRADDAQTAAVTTISSFHPGRASLACTVARGGA